MRRQSNSWLSLLGLISTSMTSGLEKQACVGTILLTQHVEISYEQKEAVTRTSVAFLILEQQYFLQCGDPAVCSVMDVVKLLF